MPSFAGQTLPSGEFFTSSDVAEIFFLQPLPTTSAARAKPNIHKLVFVAFITFVTPNRVLAHLARSVDAADSFMRIAARARVIMFVLRSRSVNRNRALRRFPNWNRFHKRRGGARNGEWRGSLRGASKNPQLATIWG